MKTSDFDYNMPKELIAQVPVEPRDHSRLMIVERATKRISHDYFYNLHKYLRPDDLLVFNDTKVFPARLLGKKESGGRVGVLLLNPTTGEFIGKNIGGAKRVVFGGGLEGEIVQNDLIKFNVSNDRLMDILNKVGYTPLPLYIKPREGVTEPNLRQRYQTVYARDLGSAAAPTAGFHFTKELMEKIPNKTFVTLHVGLGTFAPVREENIEEHKMHEEYFRVPEDSKFKIQDSIKNKKRIIAVGTTSVRVLETVGPFFAKASKGTTDIFIYPGYKFGVVDAMITNFHLPKSTLLMLVSSFAGKDLIMKTYQEAIKEKYRFFSFGDAMLII